MNRSRNGGHRHHNSAEPQQQSSSSSRPRRAVPRMDGYAAIRNYITTIITKFDGMKVLLLDDITTQVVATVYSQTDILQHSVYLIEKLAAVTVNDKSHQASSSSSTHLKAVCILRPTAENISDVCQHLNNSNNKCYAEYHILFTGAVEAPLLQQLADADAMNERITSVHEFYADYIPMNKDLWSLQIPNGQSIPMTMAAGTSWAPKFAKPYERCVSGLASMLLSMKQRPGTVRYAKSSPCAEELAKDLVEYMDAKAVTTFSSTRTNPNMLCLILDRRDDPVTPLLSQWTYQAMVHELLGLNNHRVVLKGAPGITSPDLDEVVLSANSDEFFAANRHANFGQLGEAIQTLLQEYQTATASGGGGEDLNSIEAMQQFMDKFPELKSRSHAVSKHVAIMGELARLVQNCSLMDVSQFEQSLACHDDHNAHWRELLEKLQSETIQTADKLRLAMLYVLRYEQSCNLHMVRNAMTKGGVSISSIQLLDDILRYGGYQSRGPGLFGVGGTAGDMVSRMTKNFVSTVAGIDNVYSQHVPLVMETIMNITKGRLNASSTSASSGNNGGVVGRQQYPSVGQCNDRTTIPTDIFIFMVGGITYEEGTKITEFNTSSTTTRVVLASTTIHNSTSFLEELTSTTANS